jgi:hypothetical protein
MAHQKIIVILSIPCSNSPIVGATEEYLAICTPEGVASNSIDRASVTIVIIQILIWVGYLTLMDRAVLSCSKVCDTVLILGEVDTKSSSGYEVNSSLLFLLISCGRTEHILLVWIGLPSELCESQEFKTLLHGPLDNSAITGYGDQHFASVVFVNPLKLPDDICVLSIDVLALSDRLEIISSDVVDCNVTM